MRLCYNTEVSRSTALRGMTVAEIVFALGILAFLALTLVGVFSQLVLTSSKNRDLAMAELIAGEIAERAVIEGPQTTSNSNAGWGVSNRTSEVHDYSVTKPTRYFYQVDVAQLDTSASDPGPSTPVGPDNDNLPLGHHWMVTVRVGWDGNDQILSNSKAGQGRQWVEIKKNAYYQEWATGGG